MIPPYRSKSCTIPPDRSKIIGKTRTPKQVQELFELAVYKRPEEELYAMKEDPGCLDNIADDPTLEEVKNNLRAELERALIAQKDPRTLGYGDIFDSYPRYSKMHADIKGLAKVGEYNPKFL